MRPESTRTSAVPCPRWYRRGAGRAAPSPAGVGVGVAAVLGILLAGAVACGPPAAAPDHGAGPGPSTNALHPPDGSDRPVPESMAACNECHKRPVAAFLGHGMSATLGPLDHEPSGQVRGADGTRYRFASRNHPDGRREPVLQRSGGGAGPRVQRVVGRYGAGVLDTAYVGTELDPDGRPTGRLSFLPVEHVEGHGLALAPFEVFAPGTGFDQPFAAECLQCHSTDDPATLPGAGADVTAAGAPGARIWPDALLGADAFEHLAPLSCTACHGEVSSHVENQQRSLAEGRPAEDVGLTRLGDLSAARQRDVCARCHLQGEGALTLRDIAPGGPQPDDLLARRPTIVPATPGDDFRFVGQVHRLSLSRCFTETVGTERELTCTSCHDPHSGVTAQGTASFDARCLECHSGAPVAADGSVGSVGSVDCGRPPDLRVTEVTGEPARTDDGCVDCHVRRSQPFDLGHVRTADHWVRRLIPPPEAVPLRAWEAPGAEHRVFDDGRLTAVLSTDAGRAWEEGLVSAAGLLIGSGAGPGGDAAATLAGLGDPPTPPAPLPPLVDSVDWQHLRGIALAMTGDEAGAREAYGRALALDPSHPQARLNRADLRLLAGDVEGALFDAAELLRRYPRAEKPWNLRARAAAMAGDVESAAMALVQSAIAWPSDAGVWHELARLMDRLGRREESLAAYERALALQPNRPGLAEEAAAARR